MKGVKTDSPIVPENEEGKALDLEISVKEETTDEAIMTFKRACKRLLNPPVWHELAGAASADFKIISHQQEKHRLIKMNDYLAIEIPGPGSSAGNGYDWVQVENIADNAETNADESFGVTLKTVANPDKPGDGAAHFFEEGATSTFIIKRNDKTVTASYFGRNEKPNNKDVNLKDKIRNTIVAAGAMVGISEMQWKALLKGFLEKEIGG